MAKYPLLFSGLLVAGLVQAECDPATSDLYCGDPFHSSRSYEQEQQENEGSYQRTLQSLQQAEQAESARRAEFNRSEPVIVNSPGQGARMYYPNSDGTYWQSYDR
jgi:hypothetical protein